MSQPFTIKHGSWSPDLQSNPREIPFQSYAPMEIPSADVSGVYFQDGSFRCLPAPNPYAFSIGVLLSTNFVTGTDGSSVGFDANAGSMDNPVDAQGNTIASLTSSGGQVQLSIQGPNLTASYFTNLLYGTGTNPVITLAAADASYSYQSTGNLNVWTWTAAALATATTYALLLEAFVGENVLNALTYYDEVANQEVLFAATPDTLCSLIDGVWTDLTLFGLAGSTQSVAAPSFTLTSALGGVIGPNQTAHFKLTLSMGHPTAKGQIYNGTLGAAQISTNIVGYELGNGGSVTPTMDVNGHAINAMFASTLPRGSGYAFTITLAGTLPQNYFSNLVNHTLGVTLFSANAVYTSSGGITTWKWSASTFVMNIGAGARYAMSLNY